MKCSGYFYASRHLTVGGTWCLEVAVADCPRFLLVCSLRSECGSDGLNLIELTDTVLNVRGKETVFKFETWDLGLVFRHASQTNQTDTPHIIGWLENVDQ